MFCFIHVYIYFLSLSFYIWWNPLLTSYIWSIVFFFSRLPKSKCILIKTHLDELTIIIYFYWWRGWSLYVIVLFTTHINILQKLSWFVKVKVALLSKKPFNNKVNDVFLKRIWFRVSGHLTVEISLGHLKVLFVIIVMWKDILRNTIENWKVK